MSLPYNVEPEVQTSWLYYWSPLPLCFVACNIQPQCCWPRDFLEALESASHGVWYVQAEDFMLVGPGAPVIWLKRAFFYLHCSFLQRCGTHEAVNVAKRKWQGCVRIGHVSGKFRLLRAKPLCAGFAPEVRRHTRARIWINFAHLNFLYHTNYIPVTRPS